MNKVVLILSLICVSAFHLSAQVNSVNYLIEYNDFTSLYDCKIVINSGTATTIPQRIQFNAQYSIVVPTGTQLSIEESYNPIQANQNYMGTEPLSWTSKTNLISPPSKPDFDFYSVTPDLGVTSHYNNLSPGDTIVLFSLFADIDPCENAVQVFDNNVNLDNWPNDFANGFTLGSISQIYSGNLINLYGTFQIIGSTELCVGTTTSFTSSAIGTWGNANPDIVTIDPITGSITALSSGSTMITYIDESTGCITDFELTVLEHPVLTINGDNELCVGENTAVNPATDGTWVSNNPSIATVDNSGYIIAVSPGQTTFSFTSLAGCSSVTDNITVLPLSHPACIVGLDDLNDVEIMIYPNPARDMVFVESEYPIESILIYTSDYQKVEEIFFTLEANNTQFSVDKLSKGLYILSLKSGSKIIYKKILIE